MQAAGDDSPLPPLRLRLGDDDEWEEMLEEHEEWLDENGHKLVERVVGAQKKSRGQSVQVDYSIGEVKAVHFTSRRRDFMYRFYLATWW